MGRGARMSNRIASVRKTGDPGTWTVTLEQQPRSGQRWYSVWRSDGEWRIRSEHRRGMIDINGALGRTIVTALEAYIA